MREGEKAEDGAKGRGQSMSSETTVKAGFPEAFFTKLPGRGNPCPEGEFPEMQDLGICREGPFFPDTGSLVQRGVLL